MNIKKTKKVNTASLFCCSLLSMTIANAIAQEQNIQDEADEIVVTGYAASVRQAIAAKRNADSIVDAIKAEDLGKFPDSNVAESLQRVTGVAIDRSNGEGNKVSVRGLGPEYNVVTFNNRVLPNPDGARSFSFDVLASEMISGAEVYKTSQANISDGGIGAVVNVTTFKPLDLEPGISGAGSVKGMYDELTESTKPQFSGLLNYVNDEKTFGITTSIAHQQRDARTDSAGPDAGWNLRQFDLDGNRANELEVWAPKNMGFRVEQSKRERTSALVVVQWTPDESLKLTSDVLYSQYDVESSSNQVAHWWGTNTNNAGPGSIKVDEQGTVVYWAGHAAPTEFVHSTGNRPTTTYMVGFNAEKTFDNESVLKIDVSTSEAKNDAGGTQSFAVSGFRNTAASSSVFQLVPGDVIPSLTFPSYDPISKTYSATYDPATGGYVGELTGNPPQLTDTSLLSNHFMVVEGDNNKDTINSIKLDFDMPLELGVITAVKTGAFYTDREFQRTRMRSSDAVNNGTSTSFADPIPSSIGKLIKFDNFLPHASGNFPNAWLATDNVALQAYYGSDAFIKNGTPYVDQRAADPTLPILDYTPHIELENSPGVKEENYGAYVQADFKGELGEMPWSGNLGIRAVKTDQLSTGYGSEILSIVPSPDDPTITIVTKSAPKPLAVENNYTNVLPSLNLKLNVLDDVDIRFGASKTITRPELGRIGVDVGVNARPGDNRISGGNPNLKPYKSTNLDLAANYYYSKSGYFGIAYMHKTIEDFIIQGSFPTTVAGIPFTEQRPSNVEKSGIQGIELAGQYQFDQLPGALSGLGLQINYTFVTSDSDYRTSSFIQTANGEGTFGIEGLSDTANFIVNYEYGPIQARASYNWRDKFLNKVSHGEGEPEYTGEYGQWDMSASYEFNSALSLFLEGTNVTGEANRSYVRYENRLKQYTYSGKRFAIGLRTKF
jgi:iron complex outermembrane receptor protein